MPQLDFVQTAERPDPEIYARDALYPAQPLVTGDELWQRGERFVVVQVFPFQYNPAQNQLLYHPVIDVAVTIDGVTGEALRGAQDGSGRAPRPDSPEALGDAVRVYTSARGIHRLTYADLQGAGAPVESLNPQTFNMSVLGIPVAIQVVGEVDGSFDPGDEVIFYAEPYEGRYMTENVYWLRYNGVAGPRMATRAAPLNTALTPVDQHQASVHIETNALYKSDLVRPRDVDHWYDTPLYVQTSTPVRTRTYNFTLHAPVVDPGYSGSLFSLLYGYQNTSGVNPDKTARIQINGQEVAHYLWEGQNEYSATQSVGMSLFVEGENTLTIVSDINDLPAGVTKFYVYPDYFDLDYRALNQVVPGAASIFLEAMDDAVERIRVSGFAAGTGSSVRVFDLRDPNQPVELLTKQVQVVGDSEQVEFWDAPLASPSYFVAGQSDFQSPSRIELDLPSSLQSPATSADYIAIVPSMVWQAPEGKLGIDDLLAHRQGEGLQVAKVRLQDVYDEWSYGRVDPEAIRNFLTYAYFNWNSGGGNPPTYVLLVGDGHYDFKNYFPNYEYNLLPPYLDNVDPFTQETATDNRFVSVDGPNDILPDMAVGRLPVQAKFISSGNIVDPSFDMDVMVRKIISYETTAPAGAWQSELTFVAGVATDPAGNFHARSDEVIAAAVPSAYDINRLYYKSGPEIDTVPEMRAAIHAAVDNDTLMLQWMGHGSAVNWDGSSFHNVLDTDGYGGYTPFAPNEQLPLTVAYACNSSYFINRSPVFNHYNSLAESMVRGVDRGSVADIGPTGQHVVSAITTMNKQIASTLFVERQPRVGLALDAAKYDYVGMTTAFHDMLNTTILLGDPATKLKLPPMPRLIDSEINLSSGDIPPGGAGQYRVVVVNDGDAAAEQVVVVVDYDQSKMTVNDSGGATDDGNVLTWHLDSVPVGTVELTFGVQFSGELTVGSTVSTSGTLTAAGQMPVPLSHSASIIPTVTTIALFETHSTDMYIDIRWMTLSEETTDSFNLYRSTSPDELGEKINNEPIAAQHSGLPLGASYTFEDTEVVSGVLYFYTLEVRDLDGTMQLNGPTMGTLNPPTAISVGSLTSGTSTPPLGALLVLGALLAMGLVLRGRVR